MIRLIGAALVAAGAGWLGFQAAGSLRRRVGAIRQMAEGLSLLERELMDSKYNRNLDSRVHNMNLDRLTATSRIDMAAESFSYRLDGNNVDMNTESVELAKNQLKYYTLMNSMSQEFSRLKMVLKTS